MDIFGRLLFSPLQLVQLNRSGNSCYRHSESQAKVKFPRIESSLSRGLVGYLWPVPGSPGMVEMFGQVLRLLWDQYAYWYPLGPGLSLQFRERKRQIAFVEGPPSAWDSRALYPCPLRKVVALPTECWLLQVRMAGSPWVEGDQREKGKGVRQAKDPKALPLTWNTEVLHRTAWVLSIQGQTCSGARNPNS